MAATSGLPHLPKLPCHACSGPGGRLPPWGNPLESLRQVGLCTMQVSQAVTSFWALGLQAKGASITEGRGSSGRTTLDFFASTSASDRWDFNSLLDTATG